MTSTQPVNDAKPEAGHPLGELLAKGQLPWAWANLTVEQARILHGLVNEFVVRFNAQQVADTAELIPGCWQYHPRLLHELPVLYWSWWHAHHDKDADFSDVQYYYNTYLPGFRARLNQLIGMSASSCRKGSHMDTTREIGERGRAAETLMSAPDDPPSYEYVIEAFKI